VRASGDMKCFGISQTKFECRRRRGDGKEISGVGLALERQQRLVLHRVLYPKAHVNRFSKKIKAAKVSKVASAR
jgi:hypothetical protein